MKAFTFISKNENLRNSLVTMCFTKMFITFIFHEGYIKALQNKIHHKIIQEILCFIIPYASQQNMKYILRLFSELCP